METPDHSNHKKSRVFIVEDHPVVREGLTLLIGGEGDLDVCGSSATLHESMPLIRELKPDVVVVDISLGDGNGLDLIEELHAHDPKLPILALSMHDETVYAERALRAGAKGYIMKSEAMDKVRAAIRRVINGEICVSEKMTTRMVHKLINLRVPEVPSLVEALTDREFQVFRMIAEDVGPTEIAKRLNVSVKTIETHREHIKEKLELKSGAELRRFAMQWSSKSR
jgi:DNA-binding NarL/FixJ family response regulator